MLIVQLRLTSHLLGELRPDHNGIRRFKKDKQGRMFVNQRTWQDQFQLAARNLQMDVDIRRTVIPPESLLCASVHLYRRVYSQVNIELFESFRKGTILTFDMMVRDDLPRSPKDEDMRSILRFTGERLGLSQFGSKFGFGRFALLSVTPVSSQTPLISPECMQRPTTPSGSNSNPSAASSPSDFCQAVSLG
jgi:hypothetical protein